MKKVLLLSTEFPPGPGGIGDHAYNLANSLAEIGLSVQVLSNKRTYSETKTNKTKGFKVKLLKYYKIKPFTFLNRILYTLKYTLNSNVIITSGKFYLILGGLLTFIIKGRKSILIVHGSELDTKHIINKFLNKFLIKRYDKVIAVSNYTSSFLPKNIDKSKIHIIHNGLNIEKFNFNYNFDLIGSPKLLTVGSISERKGQIKVVELLDKLKIKYKDIHYHIVGIDKDKLELEKIINKLDLTNNVTIHGAVDDSLLANYYNECTIYIMLSQHTTKGDFEGFGISILEANYFGKPTLGAKKSGIESAIVNHETGILVDTTEMQSMEDAIDDIIENYNQYSINATEWARNHFWDRIVLDYVNLINS